MTPQELNVFRSNWDNLWEKFKTTRAVWDIEEPDFNLVKYLESKPVNPRMALEIGCASGVNAVYMAQQGITVVAIDVAQRAIDVAKERALAAGVSVDFKCMNFLEDGTDLGKFDFIFDRAVAPFRNLPTRDLFAARVGERLLPNGEWLSISISNENGSHPTAFDPPRRSILDLVSAVDPYLQFLSIEATTLGRNDDWKMPAWVSVSRLREHAVHRTIY